MFYGMVHPAMQMAEPARSVRISDGEFGLMGLSVKSRLTQPLVRENGGHRSATWDEAMDCVTAAFCRSIDWHDSRDFGMFSCFKIINELNHTAQKFVRAVMETNN